MFRVYSSNSQRTRTAGLFAVCRVIFPCNTSVFLRKNPSLPVTSRVFRYTLAGKENQLTRSRPMTHACIIGRGLVSVWILPVEPDFAACKQNAVHTKQNKIDAHNILQ